MRSIVHSSVWQMCLAASTNFEIFGEILVRYSRRHGLRKDVFQGGPQGDFSKDFLRRAKSGEIWFSHSKLRKQPILLKFSKSRGPTSLSSDAHGRRSHRLWTNKRFLCFESIEATAENSFSTKCDMGNYRTHMVGRFRPLCVVLSPYHPFVLFAPKGAIPPTLKTTALKVTWLGFQQTNAVFVNQLLRRFYHSKPAMIVSTGIGIPQNQSSETTHQATMTMTWRTHVIVRSRKWINWTWTVQSANIDNWLEPSPRNRNVAKHGHNSSVVQRGSNGAHPRQGASASKEW